MGFFLATIAFVFGALTSMPPAAHRFVSAVLILLFCIFTAYDFRKKKEISKIHILEAYILSIFLIYQILKNQVPLFYFILSKISGGFSSLTGAIIGRPISMSVTYSGIDVIALFLIAFIAAAVMYKRTTPKKCALYILSTVLIWGVYIGLWTHLAESSLTLRLNLLEPVTGPLDYRAALFVMLLSFYMPVYRRLVREDADGQLKKSTKLSPIVILALCGAVTVISALSLRTPIKNGVKQIVFLDTGIDLSVPEHGKYGLDNVGMFGILPHYLNLHGYRCVTVETLDGTLLEETDVLVVFNPMRSLNDNELSEVWRFVEDGGSVLAVGDHTGDEQVRLPLNAILEPVGISLNFDSAIPFKSLWADDFQLRPSPIFSNVTGSQIQMVVGASLNIGYNAKPLVVGKAGYSDLGSIENTADGYLGDMHFSRGERIGDLILAAEASYGKGKFMVFGDTTPFQNTVIPYSYPFIDNIFAYLSDTGKESKAVWEDDGFFKGACVIGSSHMEIFGRDKSEDAADGLIACAMRAGFMPYLNRNEKLASMQEKQGDTELVVLIEPAVAFSEGELIALEQFMEKGGSVILCAGYESPRASKELAGYFGFSFDPMPIGRIAPDKNPDMAFWNACPVLYQGCPPQDVGGDVKSLMEIWGHSTIAYKTVGAGGLYVFADPDFLKNKNIESVDTYREGNVLFLDKLFRDISKAQEVN